MRFHHEGEDEAVALLFFRVNGFHCFTRLKKDGCGTFAILFYTQN